MTATDRISMSFFMLNAVVSTCGESFPRFDGVRGANRTRDSVIKSHVLCLLSYAHE